MRKLYKMKKKTDIFYQEDKSHTNLKWQTGRVNDDMI